MTGSNPPGDQTHLQIESSEKENNACIFLSRRDSETWVPLTVEFARRKGSIMLLNKQVRVYSNFWSTAAIAYTCNEHSTRDFIHVPQSIFK